MQNTGTWRSALSSFFRDHGYLVLTTLCVAVIIGCTVFTKVTYQPAAPDPAQDSQSASRMMQQSLADAAAPTPTSNQNHAPLEVYEPLLSFHTDQLCLEQTTGIWRVHPGIDLKAEDGAKVYAVAAGTIITLDESSVELEMADGHRFIYRGICPDETLQTGRTVCAGQVLGVIGANSCGFTDIPHLHLEAMGDQYQFDPVTLWLEIPPL